MIWLMITKIKRHVLGNKNKSYKISQKFFTYYDIMERKTWSLVFNFYGSKDIN